MPGSWNIRRLLRLNTKQNVNHEGDIKQESANTKPTSTGSKQKRRAPGIPTNQPAAEVNSSLKHPFHPSTSTSSESCTSSSPTGSSPSNRSYSSSSGSASFANDSSSERHSGLTVKNPEQDNRGFSEPEILLENGHYRNQTSAKRNRQSSVCSAESSSIFAKPSIPLNSERGDSKTDIKEQEPNKSLDSSVANCSSISDYVENAILVSSKTNLSSLDQGKPDLIPSEPGTAHIPPRLLSFESSSTLNHDGISKDGPEGAIAHDSGLQLHYVSLDFVKAAAQGRTRHKDDDQDTLKSTSSVGSSFLSSGETDDDDISTLGSDLATARLSDKFSSSVGHSGDTTTGNIEKDLFPLIFPGRCPSNSKPNVVSNRSLDETDSVLPPNSETPPSWKVDDFLQRNFNNSNNCAENSKWGRGVSSSSNLTGLSVGNLNHVKTCKHCSGVICNRDDSTAAMNTARDIFGQCLCTKAMTSDPITEIDYCNSNLKEVPDDVWAYAHSLTKLLLESNTIEELPKELFSCQSLRFLSVSDNDITTLPPALAGLINLNHLDISKNVVEGLPECIRCCKNLQVLDASVNPIERLSEGFTQLMSLRELYMNDCFFDFLPANFGRLSQLRVLELRDNQLQSLPKTIRRLTQLTRLDLGGNAFQDWPGVISQLTNLSELWLDCNELCKVPSDIGDLTRLTYLDLNKNFLEAVPNQIGSLVHLTGLLLSDNSLTFIPDTIGFLDKLVIFNMEFNQVAFLPGSIGKLRCLEEFDASHNKLEVLPASIGNLRALHTLLLDDNELISIPEELGLCNSLNILQISRNSINQLPESLGDLFNLRVLNVSQNRLSYLPLGLNKIRGLDALWISPNQSKPIVPLHVELHVESSRQVLINILLPQLDNGLSRANQVLSVIGDDTDDYAIDAADDDDLEAYARRERGKTHVFFNLDAITYSTDETCRVKDDPSSGDDRMDFSISDTVTSYDKNVNAPPITENIRPVGDISEKRHDLDEFTVNVVESSKPTGLSVYSGTAFTTKTSQPLMIKRDEIPMDVDNENLRNSHHENEGNLRSIPIKPLALDEFKLEFPQNNESTPTDTEAIPSPTGMRTWSSHSNLPAVLTEQTSEWNPDEEVATPVDDTPIVGVSSTNKSSTYELENGNSSDTTVKSQLIRAEETARINADNVKHRDNGLVNNNVFVKSDTAQRVENTVGILENQRNMLDHTIQPFLQKQSHEPKSEKNWKPTADEQAIFESFHAPVVITSADRSLSNLQSVVTSDNAKNISVAVSLVQTKKSIFCDIPFMDGTEDETGCRANGKERILNRISALPANDSTIAKSEVSSRQVSIAKVEGNEVDKLSQERSVAIKTEELTELIVDRKLSSITSGENLPATDHDSGVGNDVESQESIPDVPDETNDSEVSVSVSISHESSSAYKKNSFELGEIKPTGNEPPIRRSEGRWMALIHAEEEAQSKTATSVSLNLTKFSPVKVTNCNSEENGRLNRMMTNFSLGVENKRAPYTRFVPIDSTTVTYSHDYNISRARKDKQASLEDSSKNNRVADNIKKFEKIFEAGHLLPETTLSEVAPLHNGNIRKDSLECKPNVPTKSEVKPPIPSKSAAMTTLLAASKSNLTLVPTQKWKRNETAFSSRKIEETAERDVISVAITTTNNAKSISSQAGIKSEQYVENNTTPMKPGRRPSTHQRKSKFEEALAATRHKHFRDKLEKMMEQRGPALTTSRRSSRSSSSSISQIPRITSPVPHAFSPRASATALDNLTADCDWSPEISDPSDKRDSLMHGPATSSLQSTLKERLESKTTISSSHTYVPNVPPRIRPSPPVRSLGRRGSAQRNSTKNLSGIDDKTGSSTELEQKKSLEEQLGQLLLNDSSPPPGREEESRHKLHSPDKLPYLNSQLQSNTETVAHFVPHVPRESIESFNKHQRKPPMPTNWQFQLLRHIEKKKQEKAELTGMQASSRHSAKTYEQYPQPQSPPQLRKPFKPPFNPADRGNLKSGFPENNQTHKSITRSEADLEHSVQRSDIEASSKRSSLATGEQKSNFVRSTNHYQSKPHGRRSSGRFQRTRTPGPELTASETTRVDVPLRPKSAMDMPTSMPVTFDPTPYGKFDWDIKKQPQPQKEEPHNFVTVPVAPPSYHDHLLRQASSSAAEKEDYRDYVNVEYVNHLRSSVRSKRLDKTMLNVTASNNLSVPEHQLLHPLRSTGSHESILNSKPDTTHPLNQQPGMHPSMRGANSQESALNSSYLPPHHHSNQPRSAYHGFNNYCPPPHVSRVFERVNHTASKYQTPYINQMQTDSRYVMMPPGQFHRQPQKNIFQEPRDHALYDDRFFQPQPRRRSDQLMQPPRLIGYHDDYMDPVQPPPQSFQRNYVEQEDESVASAFRPYRQHQHPSRPQQYQQIQQSSQSHNVKLQPSYEENALYRQQCRQVIDPYHQVDHGIKSRQMDSVYKHLPHQYPSRLDAHPTFESEPSIPAELARHWRDNEAGVEVVSVTVQKNPTFGFHIMGGIDSGGNPYRSDDDGVFITYVAPGGAADGRVEPGDKILQVNGSDFVGITHKRAVDLLRNAGHVAILLVERSVGRAV